MNARELHDVAPEGVVQLKSGIMFDINNPDIDDIDIFDIGWSLSRQIRYNGHIPFAYTVARHSVIMSHVVPPVYAMEALLHDAGEAYVSDIVYPMKKMVPAIEEIEDIITGLIMQKYANANGEPYKKSKVVDKYDLQSYEYECSLFGRSNGVRYSRFIEAEHKAEVQNGLGALLVTGFPTDYEAFMNRFWDLLDRKYTFAEL